MKLQISNYKLSGFRTSPAHADRGDGAGERDLVYVGRYKCNSSYNSVSGVAPARTISLATARNNIQAKGAGYYHQDYAMFWTIRMLFLVEFATWDGQSVLENTTDWGSLGVILTGDTDSMSYHTGLSSSKRSVQYRYIEDPWENLLEWIDGLYFSGTNVYVVQNPAANRGNTGGTKIGSRPTTTGYINTWTVPTASGLEWALFPKSTVADESYVCDGYYYVNTGTNAYIGGPRNAWFLHGPFFMYTDFGINDASGSIGARLMKLP